MNKGTLIETIMKADANAKLSKAAAGRIADAVIDKMTEDIVGGEGVQLTGFGSFKTVEREARTYRNPQNGNPVEVAAHKVVKFTAGKKLTDAVNA
jgi:DNA-binding protein HU-beta